MACLFPTRVGVEHWCHLHAEPDTPGETEEPSRLYLPETMDGRDASTGTWTGNRSAPSLPPSDGLMSEIVATTPKDQLGPAPARRGEALTELARRHLDSGAAPTDHDNRPHLTAIIDWHTLTGDKPEGRSEYLDGTFLRPEDTPQVGLRRPHMPAHHRPHSEILDLERTRRTASPAGTTTPGPPPPVPRLSPPHHLVRRPPHPNLSLPRFPGRSWLADHATSVRLA